MQDITEFVDYVGVVYQCGKRVTASHKQSKVHLALVTCKRFIFHYLAATITK